MKIAYIFLQCGVISLLACDKKENPVTEHKIPHIAQSSVIYIPIAVIQPDSSERICKQLSDKNIAFYVEGSLAFALYIEEDKAAEVYDSLKNSKDWGDTIWSNGEYGVSK